MTIIAEEPWVVWMWQHYHLEMFTFPSVSEALSFAVNIEGDGEGKLECIEGPDGVLDKAQVEEFETHMEARRQPGPKAIRAIDVLSPNGKDWVGFESYATVAEAEAGFESLCTRFGADRLRLRIIR